MTTAPKPTVASTTAGVPVAEPVGTVRLDLSALGIDHRTADFPAQFIEFCERNNLYEMEVNAAGELLILSVTGYRGNRVYIYRAGQPQPELLTNPETLDGEDVLPGFSFPVRQYIFDLR